MFFFIFYFLCFCFVLCLLFCHLLWNSYSSLLHWEKVGTTETVCSLLQPIMQQTKRETHKKNDRGLNKNMIWMKNCCPKCYTKQDFFLKSIKQVSVCSAVPKVALSNCLLVSTCFQAMVGILQGKARGGEEESILMHDLKPFRILISLLDKPELGNQSDNM